MKIEMKKCAINTDNDGNTVTKYIDNLDDDELQRLNNLLPWKCFLNDGKGRKFGRESSPVKRNLPETIPDPRIMLLDSKIDLDGRSVLEVGCFEGIHTLALAGMGAKVVAVDSRIENVVKTLVRISAFGLNADVFKCNIEDEIDFQIIQNTEITHHVGVLYHLTDPVTHLRKILRKTTFAVLLDTHFAEDSELTHTYNVSNCEYKYKYFRESGRDDSFSGMFDHAKWLQLSVIKNLLIDEGFVNIQDCLVRKERFGPRVTIIATRRP
jgi:hypothetical protein